jgi:hypothetical protein
VGGEVYAERGLAFQPSAPLATAEADAANVQVIDVDQDGLPDLVLPGNHPDGLLWNDGPTGFDPFPSGEIVGAVGDLDGDGIHDLVCAWGGIGTDIGVRKGLGGRTFGPRTSIRLLSDVDAGFTVLDRLALADVTGDGVLDIGLVDRNAGSFVLVTGVAGTLSFTSVPVFGPLFPDLETHGNRVYATDVDRDGALELVATPVGYELWPDMNTMAVLKRDGASWSWSRQMGSPRAFRDVDGDGDADLVAERIVQNRTLEGPEAGACTQFGAGLAGLDGLTPKLGASGPFRVGETVTLRIACGRGGATATLVRGRTRADWVQGGVPVYVDPADAHHATTLLALAGAPDSAGTGTAELAFVVPAADAGVTTYFQVLVDDAAAVGGVSSSNGLTLTIGELP